MAKRDNDGEARRTYLRVSSEEQVEGFSLDAQERAIETYCREHGYQIVGPLPRRGQERPHG